MTSKTRHGLNQLLRPLASLRLAVVVLGLLAVVLAAATIVESKFGSSMAQRAVYQAAWFDLLLVLLAVNVAAAAIIRWPWRIRLVGFAITHLGILVILGGCLTTRWLGTTGRVILAEGTQDSHLVQDGWIVQAAVHGGNKHGNVVQIPVDEPPRAGSISRFAAAGQSYEMEVLRYYGDAEVKTQLVEASEDQPPAVLLELKTQHSAMHEGTAGQSMQQWLLLDDADQWSIRSPNFSLAAVSQYTPPQGPATQPGKGTLVVTIGGQDYEVDVEQALTQPAAIGDGQTSLLVKGYYEHASVGAGGKLTEDPSRPTNPAVIVELTRDGKKDKRIIFARFGDISAMHGGGKDNPVKVSLRHSMAGPGGTKVVLVPQTADKETGRQGDKEQQHGSGQPKGVSQKLPSLGATGGLPASAVVETVPKWVLYEESGAQLLQQADLRQDAPVTLKGMPVTLQLTQTLAHAMPQRSVLEKAAASSTEPRPAMEVELRGPKGAHRDWLVWGQPAVFAAGDSATQLTLQARQGPLPFAIRLDKFELEKYPGTEMPSMYRSRVTVLDEAAGEERKVAIEMNRPLEYKGWSFFQSSYQLRAGQRVSILSASKDPGKPIVYWGSFLLVLGTVILAIQRLKVQMPVNGKTPSTLSRKPAATQNPAANAKPIVLTESDHA